MINTNPTRCNICGGPVTYGSNARVYGREYGSGYCYLCERCGAYVGTHKPRPREALGLLADEPMRTGKKMCHAIFDSFWKGNQKPERSGTTFTAGWPTRWRYQLRTAISATSTSASLGGRTSS